VKKLIAFILALVCLTISAYADHPGNPDWSVISMPQDTSVKVRVAMLPYGTMCVLHKLSGRDTIAVQVPPGMDYRGIYFVPWWVAGDSDSVAITGRAVPRVDFLAMPTGSKVHNVPLRDANGTPRALLPWTSGHVYESFVPDSVTTQEEFVTGAADILEFYVESVAVSNDTLIYLFVVCFSYGGGQ
jgi:hypothetical protein